MESLFSTKFDFMPKQNGNNLKILLIICILERKFN